ncbi:hypothetical protein LCM02_12015 [Lutimonas saemankumensis]|uniref:hypothetical protein n=1 Tax=Lutimonas saemankumensis TaxID=483016 RepID=UPI001CD3F4CD|nr:hypothetical protein [Lutimonas saemankumensis]MCA0933181.1 hypothetical protein [Lutimonas saemankumensis]
MLKNLVFIVLPFVTCLVFQDNEILSVEYEASTRGSSKKITIRKDSTFIFDQEKEIELVTKKADWLFLNKQIAKLDMKKMDLFEAPTDERYSDKALSSRLTITTKSHSYESTEFDHGNPPEELKGIVKVLTRYLTSE